MGRALPQYEPLSMEDASLQPRDACPLEMAAVPPPPPPPLGQPWSVRENIDGAIVAVGMRHELICRLS